MSLSDMPWLRPAARMAPFRTLEMSKGAISKGDHPYSESLNHVLSTSCALPGSRLAVIS